MEKSKPLQASPSFLADSLGALREFKSTVTDTQFSYIQLSNCSGVCAQGCHCWFQVLTVLELHTAKACSRMLSSQLLENLKPTECQTHKDEMPVCTVSAVLPRMLKTESYLFKRNTNYWNYILLPVISTVNPVLLAKSFLMVQRFFSFSFFNIYPQLRQGRKLS